MPVGAFPEICMSGLNGWSSPPCSHSVSRHTVSGIPYGFRSLRSLGLLRTRDVDVSYVRREQVAIPRRRPEAPFWRKQEDHGCALEAAARSTRGEATRPVA